MRAEFTLTGRPKRDYRGAHVRAEWRGRVYLGEIVEVMPAQVDIGTAGTTLVARCKHFDGSPWPYYPVLGSLEILLRDWPDSGP